MFQIGDIIEATVEKLITTGKGLVRHEGWVVFVDDVIPGERVRVELTQKRKSFFIGKLLQVLAASPLRVQPRCRHFGTCGGCQLQHMQYHAQVHWKALFAEDALSHMAKLSIPDIGTKPSPLEYEYRRKIVLHFRGQEKNGKVSYTIGYIARDGNSLFSVQECPIFTPSEDPLFREVHDVLDLLRAGKDAEGHIIILKHDTGFAVTIRFSKTIPDTSKKALQGVLSHFHRWKILVLESQSERLFQSRSETDEELSFEIEGLRVFFSSRAFIQNHPLQSHLLYRDIISAIREKTVSETVVDLYSGVGVVSLLLAREGRRVISCEANKEAVRLAKKSALFNTISGIQFFEAFVEKTASQWPSDSVILANPPRTGLSTKAASDILSKKPKLFLYISCMPTTLARDLKVFTANGYKICSITVYDMFPQTGHLETMAVLER